MFPDIDAKDGFAFASGDGLAHEGVVLVGGGANLKLSTIGNKPGPTAAEPAQASGFKFFLEGIETAEGRVDGIAEFA